MSCRSIMTTDPVALRSGDTVRDAIRALAKQQTTAMPVVDDQGKYVGLFRLREVAALMLPKAAILEDRHVPDLSFVQDSAADLGNRFSQVAGDPVLKHLARDIPVLKPATSVTEALLLLYRNRHVLPVVDDGKLVGVVTILDAIKHIAGE